MNNLPLIFGMKITNNIKEQLKNIPHTSGVYLYKDNRGNIIYIGKSKNLKNRVSSYFVSSNKNRKILKLRNEISEISYITTPSEKEALLKEAELILQFRPKYNVLIKDIDIYPYIIFYNDPYPYVKIHFNPSEQGDKYGPYFNTEGAKKLLEFISREFGIRTCKYDLGKSRKKPCVLYHVNYCSAPCVNYIDKNTYIKNVKKAQKFLSENFEDYIPILQERMHKEAKKERFEIAAFYRDVIFAIRDILMDVDEKSAYFNLLDSDIGMIEFLEHIQETIGLKKIPKYIEGYDISHLAGTHTVASKVVFIDGKRSSNDYRKYKISSDKIDDFESLRNVISRRIDDHPNSIPDLFFIDGGKGQVGAVKKILISKGVDAEVVGLAKKNEIIIFDDREIILPYEDSVLRFFVSIRNEAHRFAITFNRQLRYKDLRKSFLEDVKGIGPKRKKLILSYFNSYEDLLNADEDNFVKIGIDRNTSRRLVAYLKTQKIIDL
jgi:excinuclease ABC subunit C